jgi:rifampicin phosphotransferase
VLRACAARLGHDLADRGVLTAADDLHFCTRAELEAAATGRKEKLDDQVVKRRATWERRRRLPAPVTLGRPPRLVGDVIDNAVRAARTGRPAEGALVGHPASAGRATGPVRLVHGPDDLAAFTEGEVLVARATSPAWTPLFARAAAVVTDGGTLAAHASLVAREYGIPAVVGTGNATSVLHTGQVVSVDGAAGTVTPLVDAERVDVRP